MRKQKLGPNQKRWLRALRSGKYMQTKCQLGAADEDGKNRAFCCLGVSVMLFCGSRTQSWEPDYCLGGLRLRVGNDEIFAPPKVVRSLALFDKNGSTRGWKGSLLKVDPESLWGLNDEENMSFTAIADKIEADPAKYFKEPR